MRTKIEWILDDAILNPPGSEIKTDDPRWADAHLQYNDDHPDADFPNFVQLVVTTTFHNVDELRTYLGEHRELAVAKTPEGPRRSREHSIDRILAQKEIWVGAGGWVHQLTEMSVRYKMAVLEFLRQRAVDLELSDALRMLDIMPDDLAEEMAERDPNEWLNNRPLVKEMKRQVDAGIGGTDGD